MKLVTFRVATPIGTFTRVGAIHDQSYVDVNMAYARWLADQREAQPYRMANAQVPVTMLEFLEGGPSTMAAARRAIDYAVTLGPSRKGPAGETIFYHGADVPIAAPLPNPPSLRDFPGLLQGESPDHYWAGRRPALAIGNYEVGL